MLQRVQTIYMLASVIAIFMMMLFSLASFLIPSATFELNALGYECLTPEVGFTTTMCWSIFLGLIIMLLTPLICIFLFKNRKLQLRFLIFSSVFNLLFYGLFFWECHGFADIVKAEFGAAPTVSYNFLLLAMPALSIFCNVMAMRGVIFDIALVKSLDRLR